VSLVGMMRGCCCAETQQQNQETAGVWVDTWGHGFRWYKLYSGGKVWVHCIISVMHTTERVLS